MELTFNKVKENYEAEFEVTSDFNLHIERKQGGNIYFYQRTTPTGGYSIIDGVSWQRGKEYVDIDFTALVYPKWIKIVTEVEPTVGVVTFAQLAMKRVLNSIRLNSVFLNGVMPLLKRGQGGGGSGGGGDVPDVPIEPDVPSGYEVFFASDGPFLAADGDFYVKL